LHTLDSIVLFGRDCTLWPFFLARPLLIRRIVYKDSTFKMAKTTLYSLDTIVLFGHTCILWSFVLFWSILFLSTDIIILTNCTIFYLQIDFSVIYLHNSWNISTWGVLIQENFFLRIQSFGFIFKFADETIMQECIDI